MVRSAARAAGGDAWMDGRKERRARSERRRHAAEGRTMQRAARAAGRFQTKIFALLASHVVVDNRESALLLQARRR